MKKLFFSLLVAVTFFSTQNSVAFTLNPDFNLIEKELKIPTFEQVKDVLHIVKNNAQVQAHMLALFAKEHPKTSALIAVATITALYYRKAIMNTLTKNSLVGSFLGALAALKVNEVLAAQKTV